MCGWNLIPEIGHEVERFYSWHYESFVYEYKKRKKHFKKIVLPSQICQLSISTWNWPFKEKFRSDDNENFWLKNPFYQVDEEDLEFMINY